MSKSKLLLKLVLFSTLLFNSFQTFAQLTIKTGDGAEGSSGTAAILIGAVVLGIVVGIGIGYFIFGRKQEI